ncbi:MAG: symmetrical bis(5'-nucleosyl)-tetraphosphatase [Zetaproteobacteria bacterium]|nr:symmetrical bis(5'-nucleosyl)-tetraphosphatase [Zetaproteobacteria bacterium]
MKPIHVVKGILPKEASSLGTKGRIYAVGDIQGCYNELRRALDQVKFDDRVDKLWVVGDLVNRGPKSAQVLRFLMSIEHASIVVLGNHDLHLLQLAQPGSHLHHKDNCQEVLKEPDADQLIHWLRHRPLMHFDAISGWCMVHAGLHPRWNLQTSLARAAEVEAVLRSDDWGAFCMAIQGKAFPNKDGSKVRLDHLLFTTAVMTRARSCNQDAIFDWGNRSGSGRRGDKPWFSLSLKPVWRQECRVVYGHWAARGLVDNQPHVLGLDSGCVWGGALTIARLRRTKVALESIASAGYQEIEYQ